MLTSKNSCRIHTIIPPEMFPSESDCFKVLLLHLSFISVFCFVCVRVSRLRRYRAMLQTCTVDDEISSWSFPISASSLPPPAAAPLPASLLRDRFRNASPLLRYRGQMRGDDSQPWQILQFSFILQHTAKPIGSSISDIITMYQEHCESTVSRATVDACC